MAAGHGNATPELELRKNEVALILGEEESSISVRIVSGSEMAPESDEFGAASEIVLALALRLLNDPDFHDEVLDWFYEHQEEGGEEEEEGEGK